MDISQFVKPEDVSKILKMIMANYDQSGLRFPIQKLILGPRALKMFGSQENNRLVTHILSKKLYEYLSNTKISLEVNDGEAILDARMPPLSIVDRCDISLKERFKRSVNQNCHILIWEFFCTATLRKIQSCDLNFNNFVVTFWRLF